MTLSCHMQYMFGSIINTYVYAYTIQRFIKLLLSLCGVVYGVRGSTLDSHQAHIYDVDECH